MATALESRVAFAASAPRAGLERPPEGVGEDLPLEAALESAFLSVLSTALEAVTLAPASAAAAPFESPLDADSVFAAGVGAPTERTLVLGAVVEDVAPMDRTLALGGAAEEFAAGFGAGWAAG